MFDFFKQLRLLLLRQNNIHMLLIRERELLSSCKFVWMVMVYFLVDRGWGVPYWFAYGVWSANCFWFEIGSQC